MTRAFFLLTILLAVTGCETAFRAWEGAMYLPAALIVRPMSRFVGRQCLGSTIPWDGTANAPCRAQLRRAPTVEVSWSWMPVAAPIDSSPMLYAQHCAPCHDHAGRAPDLRASEFVRTSTAPDLTFFLMMGRPAKGMPAWGGGRLPMEEIEGVAKYIKR